jgi:hypothetical protein
VSDRAALQAAPDVHLLVSLPAASIAEPTAALPEVPLPPGLGEVAARAGWTSPDGARVRVACVRAPSDRWAPGIEELVLARASDIARGASGAALATWTAGAPARVGLVFSQRLDGSGERGGAPVLAAGRHLLGFRGPDHEALLCSVVCTAPRAAECGAVAESAVLEGALVGEPPPTWWVQALLFAAERPRLAGGGALLAALVLTAVILWRRPRVPR